MTKYWKLKVTDGWDMLTEPYRLIDDYTYLIKCDLDLSEIDMKLRIKMITDSIISVYHKLEQRFVPISRFSMVYDVELYSVEESELRKLIIASELSK